jgi:hypothetical protein
MQMYEAVWRSDGERVGVFYMRAANEAVVLTEANLFLQEHPNFRRSTGQLTLSISVLSSAERSHGLQSARKTSTFSIPSAVEQKRFRSKRHGARCNGFDTRLKLRRSRRERGCTDGAREAPDVLSTPDASKT